jgi:hypothetical protein
VNPIPRDAVRTMALAAWPMAAAALVFPWWGAHRNEKIGILVFLCALTAFHWTRQRAPFTAGWRWLPYALSLLTLTLFTALGILSVANFSNFDLGDISYYLSSFHDSRGWLPGANAISGRLFLAHHSEFACIPVGWLFKLHPAPITIQLAQAGALTAAWMLFRNWIVARSSDKAEGEWIAFGFAFCPCLLTLMLKGFHGVSLGAPFLVLAATAFHDRKWIRFLSSLILLLLVKEVFTFTAIALGGLALLQRRPWHWIVVPIALGLGYGLFLRFFFFPMMLKDSVYYYSTFADGWSAMLGRLFSGNSLKYLFQLALWGGSYAILRSPYLLLALPPIGLNLVLNGAFSSPTLHYIMEPSFWIYFAAATSFLNPVGRAPGPEAPLLRHRRLVALAACMLLMNFITRQGLPLYRHHKYEASYRQALAAIPEGETLSLGATLEDHLWKMKRFYWIHYAGESWLGYSEEFGCREGRYALLPRLTGINGALDLAEEERLIRCRDALARDPGYRMVWTDSVLVLFAKRD